MSIRPNGEFMRLIQYNRGDEFIMNLCMEHQAGWNLDNCSPLYTGLTSNANANKFWERNGIIDISQYGITGNVTVANDSTINQNVLQIAGIGGLQGKQIKVSPGLDYEFFFMIQKTPGADLTVGFDAFDINGNAVNLVEVADGSTVLNHYITLSDLQRNDQYLAFSFMLYNSAQPVIMYDTLSLKMPSNVAFVAPKILLNSDTAQANIYDLRFVPASTPYSKSFLQIKNWIDLFYVNNYFYSEETIWQILKKYLLPYNAEFGLTEINTFGNNATSNFQYIETEDSNPINSEGNVVFTP